MQKGRPKGGKNKYWSVEEKYKIIKPILNYELSSREVTRRTGINNGLISTVLLMKKNMNSVKMFLREKLFLTLIKKVTL